MTHSATSPVTRITDAKFRRRPIIVEVRGRVLAFREFKRPKRTAIDLDIEAAYDLALKLKAREIRDEKARKKAGRT
jgi:hypothetical protein